MSGIYIHIPFCKSKCVYCDFASYPNEIGKIEAYFACLYKEMKYRAAELKDKQFKTVYFGGGTPSFIDPKYILGASRLIKQQFKLTRDAEITIEINPKTLTKEKLAVYERAGINRFSVGMQCADDKILADLNRTHTTDDFINTMRLLSGKNISVDIMIGINNQDQNVVKKSIDLAIFEGASHISVYALKPEEGTIMYSRYLNGDLPDEDSVAALYEFCVDHLKAAGFFRYEVSNFAKTGFESKHNLNYWNRGEYIGLGVGSSSFIDGRRFTNTNSIDDYVFALLSNRYAEVFSERIDDDEAKSEYIMLRLRTKNGIDFSDYKSLFCEDFLDRYQTTLDRLKSYLTVTERGFFIKDEFLFVQNNIIIQFME